MIEFAYPEGATPLDVNEIEGLLLTHITTRAELDRWEQDNINEALIWAAALTSLKMGAEGPFRGDIHDVEALIQKKYRPPRKGKKE